MAWYKEWFGDDYVDLYSHRDAEEAVRFIDTLENKSVLKNNHKVLDLCCGAGRYSIELAKRGYNITGQDLSKQLIDQAAKNADLNNVRINFILRDMRDIPYKSYFDSIINMFTSFGYFANDEENENVVKGISNALIDDGWLIIDFINKDFVVSNLKMKDEFVKNGMKISQYRKYDVSTKRLEKQINISSDGVEKEYLESVRLYELKDFKQILKKHNIDLVYYFGNYNGCEYSADSPRLIIVGRKN